MIKRLRIFLIAILLAMSACDSPEQKANSYVTSGLSLLALNKPEFARLEFKNALKINDKLVSAWYGLAQVEERQGHWGKVFELLKKVVALDPTHIQAQVKVGKLFLLAGQLDKALDASTAASKLDPANPKVRALRAAVLYRLDDTKGAVKAAKSALEVDPSETDAIAVLVAERLAAKDTKSALDHIDRGLKHDKENIALHLLKIRTLDAANKRAEAETEFRNLIALYPQRPEFRKSLIRYLLGQKLPDEAVKEARRLAADNPDDPDARLDVVRVLNATQGAEAAKSELSDLIRAYPKDDRFRFALAQLLRAQGKISEATEILTHISQTAEDQKSVLSAKAGIAEILLQEKKPDAAMPLIKEILAQDEDDIKARLLWASIDIEKGHLSDAIAKLRSVLANGGPPSTSALLLLAKAYRLNGDAELADNRFAEAFRVSADDAAVGLLYVRFLMRGSKLDKAEDVLTTILARDPGNAAALRMLAQVRLARNDWRGAQDAAERLKKVPGETPAVDKILGQALEGQRKFDESIAHFRLAQEASPSALSPMASLVQAYLRAGRRNDAERFLNAVLRSNDGNPHALVLLARLGLSEEHGAEKAEALLKRAVALDPRSPLPYRELARLYASQGKYGAAEETAVKGLADNPNDAGLRFDLAGFFERQGKIDDAIGEYERLLKADPDSDIYANNLAALLSENRDDKESLQRAYGLAKRFREAGQPAFKDTLGWINYRLGSLDAARSQLADAVKGQPQSPIYRYHLGMALQASRENDAAYKEFRRCLDLAKDQPFDRQDEVKELLRKLSLDEK